MLFFLWLKIKNNQYCIVFPLNICKQNSAFISYIIFVMKDIFFLWIQWCGKWTQAKMFLQNFGDKYEYLEMWQLFRANMSNDNIVWNYCKDIVNSGKLVPHFVSHGWFNIALQIAEEKWKNLLIDGFPRSLVQSKFAEDKMEEYGRDFVVVHFELSKEKAIERIMGRAKKEWRADDNEASIRTRLEAFENETLPAIRDLEWKWKVITINADQTVDEIFNEIVQKLELK